MRTSLALLLTIMCSYSCAIADDLNLKDIETLISEGEKLSEDQVKSLEDRLKANPKDESSRIQLVSYYQSLANHDDAAYRTWQQQFFKLIEYHPESEFFSGGSMAAASRGAIIVPLPIRDNSAFEEGITLWKRLVKEKPNDPRVLANAASWLILSGDRDQAKEYLRRAQRQDPKDARWAMQISIFYAFDYGNARRLNGMERRVAFENSVEYLDESYSLTNVALQDDSLPDKVREELLGILQLQEQDLMKAAFEADQFQKARQHATNLLASLPEQKKNFNHGNIIHDANIILGRVALKEDLIDTAKHYFLEAGRTPGSPQLNSFGPNVTLADELLALGERDVVLEYLDLCAKFWKSPMGRLDQWTEEIRSGRTPKWSGRL